MANFASFKPLFFRIENILFAEVEAYSEVSSGDIEMNVVAAEGRGKRDILRDLQRFGLIERHRARNP